MWTGPVTRLPAPAARRTNVVLCGTSVICNSLPEMSCRRHARRGVPAVLLVVATLLGAPGAVSAARTEPPGDGLGKAPNGVSKASTKPTPDPRNQMPGYLFRSRDKLAVDAADALSLVLRQPNTADIRIAAKDVTQADFTTMSVMPEGLLESMQPQEVSDLFAYLMALTTKP